MKSKSFFSVLALVLIFNTCYSQWTTGTYGIYNNVANKNVAIGSTGLSSSYKFAVTSDMPYGIYNSNIYSTSLTKYGIYSYATGSSTTTYGMYSYASSTSGNKYGVYAVVAGNGDKYGVYSECSSGYTGNVWSGYFKNGTVEIDHAAFIIGGAAAGGNIKKFMINTQHWVSDPHSLFITPSIDGNPSSYDATKAFEFTDQGILKIQGKLIIGNGTTMCSPADSKASIDGKLYAREVVVNAVSWCDYVFKPDYKLMPICDLKEYIKTNSHLPDVPTEKDVITDGINLGNSNAVLLKKIEELTLYVIQQEERIKELELSVHN
jgi:hypothetical protein